MNSQSFRSPAARAALVVGLLSTAAASAHLTTGNLEGKAAAGDSVTVRNIRTEHTLDLVVADTGRFRFQRLPIGIYEVVIHHSDGSTEEPILARARLGETVRVN